MSYVYYNPNPGKKHVGDCVLRAITKTENISWEKAFAEVTAEAFRLYDMPSSNYVWGSYLRSKGYTRNNLPNTCPECYTIDDFCMDHPTGEFIVATGTHVAAVSQGNVWDSWDSSNEIIVYYWEKEETYDG